MNVDAAKWGDGFDNGFDLFVNVMAIVHRGRLQANGLRAIDGHYITNHSRRIWQHACCFHMGWRKGNEKMGDVRNGGRSCRACLEILPYCL